MTKNKFRNFGKYYQKVLTHKKTKKMDKKRRLIFGMFCLLMLVFALDIGYAQLKKTSNLEFLEKEQTVEEQIESMNTRLSQIEILEFRKNKMVNQEEEKIKNSKIMLKILREDLGKLEKERTEIMQKKLVLKIKK